MRIKNLPYQCLANVALAVGLAGAGKEEKARNRLLPVLDYASDKGADDGALLYAQTLAAIQLGLLDLGCKRRDEAASALDQAGRLLAATPDNFKSVIVESVLEYSFGQLERKTNPDSAIAHMKKAAEIAESVPQDGIKAAVQQGYASLLVDAGRDDEALHWYNRAVATAEAIPTVKIRALLGRGACQLRLEDAEAALTDYHDAALIAGDATDDYAAALRGEGRAYFAIGDFNQAVGSYRRTLGSQASDELTWQLLGDAYEAMERHRAAAGAYRRAWDIYRPRKVELALEASASLIAAGGEQEAITFLDNVKTILKDPDGRIDYQRAAALDRLKSHDEARQALSAAAAAGYKPAADQLSKTNRKAGSWAEYWFGPSQSRSRLTGIVLVAAITIALAIAVANPSARWMHWVNPGNDWATRLGPALILLALLVLPTISHFKVGPVEVDPLSPSPELQSSLADNQTIPLIDLAKISLTQVVRPQVTTEMTIHLYDTLSAIEQKSDPNPRVGR